MGFYDLNPILTYNDVVDVLYSSIKYKLKLLIKQCYAKLISIDNVNDFFIVLQSFSFYPKALFESFFVNNFTSKSQFIDDNIEDIISDDRFITNSSFFIIQIFCQFVLSLKLINNTKCYELLTNWCRYTFNYK